MKLEFSRQIFERISNIKFHQNRSSGSRVLCGRTDKNDEAFAVSEARFSAPKWGVSRKYNNLLNFVFREALFDCDTDVSNSLANLV